MSAAAAALPPVFLLGGRLNTLSAARSLGSRGVTVHLLDDRGEGSLVAHSRHCDRYLDTPCGATTAEWWMEELTTRAAGAVVLPCNDTGLELLARHRSELVAAGCLPIEADGPALLLGLDKEATYDRARELGVSAPRTILLRSDEDVTAAAGDLAFPFAVKPVSAHRFWEGLRTHPELLAEWGAHPKGVVLEDERHLVEVVAPLVAVGVELLATEVIVGPDDGFSSYYSYLTPDGEPLFHFTKRKPRQYPIHFGAGTFHVTQWLPDVADLGLRVFQGMGFRGICNVEFKRDVRSGELRLVEVNARLTATDALERRAGLDIPWIAYSRAIGVPVSVPERFADGLCQWLPRTDLRAFRAYRRAGELSTKAWLASLARRQSFAVLDRSDLGPSRAALARQAGSLARRLRPAWAGSRSAGDRARVRRRRWPARTPPPDSDGGAPVCR